MFFVEPIKMEVQVYKWRYEYTQQNYTSLHTHIIPDSTKITTFRTQHSLIRAALDIIHFTLHICTAFVESTFVHTKISIRFSWRKEKKKH
jgi:hypothetical protein